jgi:hypothetical protein
MKFLIFEIAYAGDMTVFFDVAAEIMLSRIACY